MKRISYVALAAILMLVGYSPRSRAQEDKPLAPGWLSLDSSIGQLDSAIGNGKAALEKALGISISGYLDTSWTLSTNHPSHPANISGQVGS